MAAQTVAIIPGFAEGQLNARRLKHALKSAGYETTHDTEQADIIIAHSGGCYLVPEPNQAKLVIHIGYTYWPNRSLPRAARMKMADEYRRFSLSVWSSKTALNTLYAFNIRNTWRNYRGYKHRKQLVQHLPAGQIFVRNRYDPYCNAEELVQLAGNAHTYISFPGYHDHIWDEPELYINLLKSLV